jgi:serine/threonine-protein kinase
VAFVAEDHLQRVSLTGGEPKVLCEARTVYGVTWADDQNIYFTRHEFELVKIPAGGGRPEVLVHSVVSPFALPGGVGLIVSDFLAAPSGRADYWSIVHVSPEGRLKPLLKEGYNARYVPTGHLVFMRGDRLHAAAFDLERLEVTGPVVPVVDGVWTDSIFPSSLFSVSNNGTLVYAGEGDWARTIPTWIDRQGREEPLAIPAQVYNTFRLSPDGRRLALHAMGPTDQIYVFDIERKTSTRLTLDASNGQPAWTADGKRVVFLRRSTTPGETRSQRATSRAALFWKSVDGSGEAEQLISAKDVHAADKGSYLYPVSVSPDGTFLSFCYEHPTQRHDIWLLPLDPDVEARPLIATEGYELGAFFSPDGRWIAYWSNKTGRDEVFVRPFPSGDREWQISSSGGYQPLWSARGDQLFYRHGKRLMVVPVSTESEFRAGTPQVVFERDDFGGLGIMSYQVSPDGQRILIGKSLVGARPVTELKVVVNWFEELKEKMRQAGQATEKGFR